MEDCVECVQLTKGEVQYIHLVFQICLVQLCMEGISINRKEQQQGTKKKCLGKFFCRQKFMFVN